MWGYHANTSRIAGVAADLGSTTTASATVAATKPAPYGSKDHDTVSQQGTPPS